MPGENIYDWSTTASSNDTADSLINWREGMARAAVNDSSRGLMAAHAKARDLWNGTKVTGGTANAQTFTSGVGFTVVPTGMRVLLKIGVGLINTGAVTLNMDTIGAIAVKYPNGDDLLKNAFEAGSYVDVVYNGTNWVMLHAVPATAIEAPPPATVIINNTTIVTPITSVDFTSNVLDDTFNPYIFTFYGVRPSAATAILQMRMSTDGGATWLSAVDSYQNVFNYTSGGTGAFTSAGSSAAQINLTVTLTNTYDSSGTVEIYRRAETIIRSAGVTEFAGLGLYGYNGSGVPNFHVRVNAVRFLMSTGNIGTGTFTMSGVRVPT